jgi:hypothetical protein
VTSHKILTGRCEHPSRLESLVESEEASLVEERKVFLYVHTVFFQSLREALL